ncbi:MAG: histidine kinase N-terminal 7TM domain-containing protein [Natrialbaceae archaeon]|nr:histidine kinase N-terminal 7TM domain-containing protein [Natrialbaceae archaeon]
MIDWGVWPAAVSTIAGVAVLPIIWYVWRLRHRPGGPLWLGVLVCIAAWSVTYGIALLTFTPATRELLEIPLWLAKTMAPPFILAFALAYTGRIDVSRGRWIGLFFGVFALAFLLIATNSWHQLMWTNYHIEPVLDVATVNYEIQPALYLASGLAYVVVGAALVLLLETLLSYGRLFYRQALALSAAIAVPTITNILWITGANPVMHLDLTPPSFVITGVLTTYALFHEDMFSLHPATRRIGDRVAVDDLGTAVVTVNRDGTVLGLNPKAQALFNISEQAAVTRPVSQVTDMDFPLEIGESTLADPQGLRTYRVVVSKFDTASTRPVGYTIAFHDITRQRRRRQRLEVLNRVLRHNLRNDATIIEGNARLIQEDVKGTELENQIEPRVREIFSTSRNLIRASEKARDIAKALPDGEPTIREVDIEEIINECVTILRAHDIDGEVTRSIPDDITVSGDEKLLRVIIENVLENAFLHGGGSAHIELETVGSPKPGTVITVEDEGGGIPDHEVAAIEAAEEIRFNMEADLVSGS